jgi:hypothetical protein
MKATIYTSTFGQENENQVTVSLNRYKKGFWTIGANGISHEYEIVLNGKVVSTMRATVSNAKKEAEKMMIKEFVYLNPLTA